MKNKISLHVEHRGEPTGKVYPLVYLADLDTVPIERLDQLFAEIKAGLVAFHHLREITKALAAQDGIELPDRFMRMCVPEVGAPWKDDGKGAVDIIFPKECGSA